MMYDIYTKKIQHAHFGTGTASLIVKDGIICAHINRWNDPWTTTPDGFFIPSELVGQPATKRGKGWRKLTGFAAENAQGWAAGIVEEVEANA